MAEMSEQELEALARVSGGEVKDGQIVVQEDLGGEEETTPPDPPETKKPEGSDESSLTPEQKERSDKGGAEPPLNPEQKPTAKSFEEQFKEKTGFDFSDEVVGKLKAEPKEASLKFANEQIKKMNELIAQGVPLHQIIQSQSIKTDGVSAHDLIVQKLRYEDPDISDREIRLEMRKYSFDAENDPEEEVEDKKAMLERDARKARKFFESEKEKLLLPSEDPGNNSETESTLKKYRDAEEQQKTVVEENKKLQQRWNAQVSDNLKEYKSEKIQIDQEHSFEYEVSPEVRKKLEDAMSTQVAFSLMFVEEGKGVDIDKLRKTMLMALDGDNLVKALAAQMISSGKKDLITKEVKNINMDANKHKPDAPEIKSAERQIGEKYQEF